MLTVDLARLEIEPGAAVLDLGCGGGRHAFSCLRAGAHVVALDADEVELKKVAAVSTAMEEEEQVTAGGLCSPIRASALELPFCDSSFSCVIAAEVLEHLPDDAGALAELVRVLRPGGRLAVTVPRYGPELVNWMLSAEYHEIPGGHVRVYSRTRLEGRLAAFGLEVVGRHYAHGLHSPYWWLRCLVGVEREGHRLVAAYHRALVREIVSPSPLGRLLDRLLTPVIGKSLVLYLEKQA